MVDNSSSVSVSDNSTYCHELISEEERLENLFRQLDLNQDGRIDIHELSEGLKRLGHLHGLTDAQKFIESSDYDNTGDVNLREFINYMKQHEKKLLLVFKDLDLNRNGKLDQDEIIKGFWELGIRIDQQEAHRLLQRMKMSCRSVPKDKLKFFEREFLRKASRQLHLNFQEKFNMDSDGSLEISFDEWRDYLRFQPSTAIKDIFSFWRHSTCLDIGEDINVPDDFTENELISGMWWRHLVAGGVAGAVSRSCTAPLDRLKVFLQVHGKKQFSGITSCLQHMLKEGGVRSLWRGNGINVMKIAPESALKFMAYEQAKRAIRGNTGRELQMHERFLAGSFAGGFSQSAIYPLEVLKTRLALRKTGEYTGMWDAAKKIYRFEGLKSFYRGYLPNLLGILPYAGIDLAVYETLKKLYLKEHSEQQNPGVLVLLTCGTVSSTCGQIASYPLALVRTRLQAQTVTARMSDGPVITTMTGLFRNIVQTEGVPGLYRGIAPNFMKVAPAVSISYVIYERCRQTLGVGMT